MDIFTSGWFTELSPDAGVPGVHSDSNSDNSPVAETVNKGWKGQAFSLKSEEVLYHERSKYQDILIFKSETYGRVLVLDGVIQCTERDECSYQEMLAHIPITLNPSAKKVLIIGGGDGGVLREVLKHDHIESVVLCEIDDQVVEACSKFLPSMAASFSNPKVKLHFGDGLEFMRKNENTFDIIITDSSDPIGPAETLFTDSYYQLINQALAENGVLSSQAESIWLHLDLIKGLLKFCNTIFPVVGYAYSSIPSYPCGTIGYLVCSKNKDCIVNEPRLVLADSALEKMSLKFYTPDIHKASFVLPRFAQKALNS